MNNKLFKSRNIAIAIITLAIGTFAAFGAAKIFFSQTTTVSGTVASFILNPEGKIDGAVLNTGDQVHFGAETGEVVASQVKVGDALSATGRAGSKSDYGRELRAETLQIGDQTINISPAKPRPPRDEQKPSLRPGDDPKRGPRPDDDKMPSAPDAKAPDAKASIAAPAPDAADAPAPDAKAPVPPPPAPVQTVSAQGQVQTVLVGAKGEPRGLILSGDEQVDLPKEVSDANLTFNQGTEVSVEGESAKGNSGTFIRPMRLTIGNQTFSFNH